MGRSYIHLAVQERALIETQLRLGMNPAAIAAGLMRAPSTVTREIRRNGWLAPAELFWLGRARIAAGGYRCLTADRRARRLAVQPRVPRKLVPGNALWSLVVDHLHQGCS
jgi:IS30 family transposase